MQQFVNGQAQNVAIHGRHAFNAPMFGVFGDLAVDFRDPATVPLTSCSKKSIAVVQTSPSSEESEP